MKKAIILFLGLLILLPTIIAHGFGQRIDLPIPLNLYVWGGALVVVISFLVIMFYSKKQITKTDYPVINLLKFSFFRFFVHPVTSFLIKLFFVLLFILVIATGLFGTQNSAFNLAPTTVWILFGVGLTYFSAFIGNIWQFINPLKSLFEWIEYIYHKITGKIFNLVVTYPTKLGVWPAFLLFFIYRWIENAYPRSANPSTISFFIIMYSVVTIGGMFYFGKESWLKHGDPFSVFFTFLSKFSVIEFTAENNVKYLNLRPPAVGLLNQYRLRFSGMLFILLMLSTITYDGLKATQFWSDGLTALYNANVNLTLINTIGLLLVFAIFIFLYLIFSYFTKLFSGSNEKTIHVGSSFVLSLLPIAIAYEIAHFLTILLIEGQRIIYLISDPFGFKWNLFGTLDYSINFAVVNFFALWNVQVALIVIGHIIAIYLAHDAALMKFQDRKIAKRSQYPMLILMILYTTSSLWILAQPLIAIE